VSTEHLQRRTLRLLFTSQVAGSVGVGVGLSVGALLAADMVSIGVSGLAQSAVVLGSALFAVPATRLARSHGRGPSLSAAYLVAAIGAFLTVTGAMTHAAPLLFVGFFLFGGATTASFQARFAAVDLAPKARYGRDLSIVVWAATLGGVAGPNLASVSSTLLSPYGVPTLAAPFVLSTALFVFAGALLFTFLRPDPLRTAQGAGGAPTATRARDAGMRAAFRAVWSDGSARLGVTAVAVSHFVMVGVMSMTPVHIRGAGHPAADTLRIVGIVLSVHVAGMYAFSPVMGWLSDRVGRDRVILGGVALLLTACAVAGTAGHDSTRLAVGLLLLGLGWSASMVAGSTMLSVSTPAELKPSAQGLSDLIMGVAGASAGALSGLVVQGFGYPTLTLAAAVMAIPLAAFAAVKRPAV
jgi:MFS family permease